MSTYHTIKSAKYEPLNTTKKIESKYIVDQTLHGPVCNYPDWATDVSLTTPLNISERLTSPPSKVNGGLLWHKMW